MDKIIFNFLQCISIIAVVIAIFFILSALTNLDEQLYFLHGRTKELEQRIELLENRTP